MKKKFALSLLAALLMVMLAFPSVSHADETVSYNLADYVSGGTITISAGVTATVTGSSIMTYSNIKIECGAGVKLTLKDVIIDDSGNSGCCPLSFTGTGNTLTLTSANELSGGGGAPAIHVTAGTALDIGGSGSLSASGGGSSAGIGGAWGENGGVVTVTGCTVTAKGADNAHDIGSGAHGTSGGGGNLTLDGTCFLTLASKGTDATVKKGDCYILDNSQSSPKGVYYIGGTAFDGTAVDIHNGDYTINSAGNYLITGTTTTCGLTIKTPATVVLFGTNISSRYGAITVDTSGALDDVKFVLVGANKVDGYQYSGILCMNNSHINISGSGSLTAIGRNGFPGIGGAKGVGSGSITIDGGNITAKAASDTGSGISDIGGAGIGGSCSNGETFAVTIKGGSVTATGAQYGPGIGSSYHASGTCTVSIEGGTVTANGGGGAAGIGTGYQTTASTPVSISGGKVTANGTESMGVAGSGIGFGSGSTVGSIQISGTADVTATGGAGAPGIGCNGDNIAISGGRTVATGGGSAAGIGGTLAAGKSVDILGGTVFAAGSTSDIGDASWQVNIAGNSAVFFKNKVINATVSTNTHNKLTVSADTASSTYGAVAPAAWTADFGAYLRFSTLSYDLNGGSGFVSAPLFKYYKETCTLPDGTGLMRDYYDFTGWNTAADGGGMPYAPYSTFTFTDTATLYAQWAGYPYTVKFNGNGGDGGTTGDQNFAYGTQKALTANGFTKRGYAFAGWAETADGAVKYADKASVQNLTTVKNGEIPLYAKWDKAVYTIAYDPNGGSLNAANPKNYNLDTESFTLKNPTRTGYTFAGWTGTDLTRLTQNVTIAKGSTGNRTYKANWNPVGYTIGATSGNNKYGSVKGGGSYAYGSAATLTAVPADGYRFVRWMEGKNTVSYSAVYTFTVSNARTLSATFEKIAAPKLSSVKASGKKAIKLTWKAVSGAKGYYIYCATSKTGKYSLVKNVSALSYTHTGLKAKKTYYYKIKAYCATGTKITTGGYSNVLSAKVK